MPAWVGDRADVIDRRFGNGAEAGHVRQRVALPAHAADFFVVMSVAVGTDIEARCLLCAQMHRDRVLVLLAVAGIDQGLKKTLGTEDSGVPGRPRQRSDDRGR